MFYTQLRRKVADQSGYPQEVVQIVLESLVAVLADLATNERVRTPLGVFRKFLRKNRLTNPPPGVTDYILIPGEYVVKLWPGKKLRFPV